MSTVVITGKTSGPCGCCASPPVCEWWNPGSAPSYYQPVEVVGCVGAKSVFGGTGPELSVSVASSTSDQFVVSASRASVDGGNGGNVLGGIHVLAGKKIIVDGAQTGGADIYNNEIRIFDSDGVELGSQFTTTPGFHYELTVPEDGIYTVGGRFGALVIPFGPTALAFNFSARSDGPAIVACAVSSHSCPICSCIESLP